MAYLPYSVRVTYKLSADVYFSANRNRLASSSRNKCPTYAYVILHHSIHYFGGDIFRVKVGLGPASHGMIYAIKCYMNSMNNEIPVYIRLHFPGFGPGLAIRASSVRLNWLKLPSWYE